MDKKTVFELVSGLHKKNNSCRSKSYDQISIPDDDNYTLRRSLIKTLNIVEFSNKTKNSVPSDMAIRDITKNQRNLNRRSNDDLIQ